MKGYKIIVFFFFFCCISQAATCDDLRKKYQNKPSNRYEKQMFLDSNVIQLVSIPEYIFTGTPGKLPRPVLFVHGFNSNYEEWDVVPLNSKNDTEGKVKARIMEHACRYAG